MPVRTLPVRIVDILSENAIINQPKMPGMAGIMWDFFLPIFSIKYPPKGVAKVIERTAEEAEKQHNTESIFLG